VLVHPRLQIRTKNIHLESTKNTSDFLDFTVVPMQGLVNQQHVHGDLVLHLSKLLPPKVTMGQGYRSHPFLIPERHGRQKENTAQMPTICCIKYSIMEEHIICNQALVDQLPPLHF